VSPWQRHRCPLGRGTGVPQAEAQVSPWQRHRCPTGRGTGVHRCWQRHRCPLGRGRAAAHITHLHPCLAMWYTAAKGPTRARGKRNCRACWSCAAHVMGTWGLQSRRARAALVVALCENVHEDFRHAFCMYVRMYVCMYACMYTVCTRQAGSRKGSGAAEWAGPAGPACCLQQSWGVRAC